MAFGLNHRRAAAYAFGLVACLTAGEVGFAAIASAETAGDPALGTQRVAVARPGEAVPVIEAPAALPEPAAGVAVGSSDEATENGTAAVVAEPAPAVPADEADGEPVLTIDPVLEGISASRPILRGLDKLLERPAIAARPERPGSMDDPELAGFAEESAQKLEPPVAPDDPVWRARSRPPVSLTGAVTGPEVHGEAVPPSFLARAGGGAVPMVVVETR